MSIQEQRRKAYEEWEIRENGYRPEDFSKVSGEYRHQVFRERFECWNAALDSVVIEMPEHCWLDVGMIDSVRCFEAEDVEDAIKAAGLKVKP